MTNTPAGIFDDHVNPLRAAITELPEDRRGDFARLVILILLIDMDAAERAVALSLLSTFYFQETRQ